MFSFTKMTTSLVPRLIMKTGIFVHLCIFILVDLLVASNDLASRCKTWNQDKDSENNLDKSIILLQKDDCLLFDCAILCNQNSSCRSFFHHPTLNRCLISQSYKRSLPDGYGTQQEWIYYTEPQKCDGDYTFNQTLGLCYKMHPEDKNAADAMNACESEGAKVIIIKDEMAFLHFRNAIKGTPYWYLIGLRRIIVNGNTTWKWWNGQEASYLNWGPGEPNNMYGNEYCVGFLGGGDSYHDDNCASIKSFICQRII